MRLKKISFHIDLLWLRLIEYNKKNKLQKDFKDEIYSGMKVASNAKKKNYLFNERYPNFRIKHERERFTDHIHISSQSS